jgi:cysteine desulfurase
MERDVYLDNSATTRVLPEVAEVMGRVLTENYGNPSSLHVKGMEAEKLLAGTRRVLASCCQVKAEEVVFTSGGTEANNLAVKGAARRNIRRGKHIITTGIEHPSVLYACRALEQEGFDVTYLDVDAGGRVDPQAVSLALSPATILVSVMHINNEVGTVQPVAEIGRLVKRHNPAIIYHVDAVQSFGKLPVLPESWQADLVSFSAHKIHGPKGTGALYCRTGTALEPLIHGGDQERALRPGTENTAGIAGFAEAIRLACQDRAGKMNRVAGLKQRLAEGILGGIDRTAQNGSPPLAPHILSVTIAGVRGEVLVHALAEHGIYISTGSACHSRRADPSHVLLAMGRTAGEIEASLRFSFSAFNTAEEIDYTLEKLRQAVADFRLLAGRKK